MLEKKNKTAFLILIGGAEDKRRARIVIKSTLSATKAKKIIIIPTASSYPRDVEKNYEDAFHDLGVENLETLDIRYRDEVDKPENLQKLEACDLIYFSGGDQVRLVDIFRGSAFIGKVKEYFYKGKLSIAGTSAGAAAASNPMLFDGDYSGFIKGTVNFVEGFGFLKDIIVDTHFLARERIPRLMQVLAAGKSKKAIGLDEDTGIIVNSNLQFEVIGTGMVTVINAEKNLQTDFQATNSDDVYSINNLKIGFLAPGTKFSIKRWTILKTKIKKKLDNIFSSLSLN